MLIGNSRAALTSCAAEWDAFVAGLRFPRYQAQVAAPAPASTPTRDTTAPAPIVSGGVAGGIVGVWSGAAMSSGDLKVHHAVFFANGAAYFGPSFPLRGLLDIDIAAERSVAARYWGTYTFGGGAGVLTMPYGAIPMRGLERGALELTTNRTAHKYFRTVMPDTATIAGNWCLSGGECLRLVGRGTGRFEDGGAVRVLEHSTSPSPQSPARGVGAYVLRDNTLVLRYDGGKEMRIAVPGVASGSSQELVLSFNLDVLTRRP